MSIAAQVLIQPQHASRNQWPLSIVIFHRSGKKKTFDSHLPRVRVNYVFMTSANPFWKRRWIPVFWISIKNYVDFYLAGNKNTRNIPFIKIIYNRQIIFITGQCYVILNQNFRKILIYLIWFFDTIKILLLYLRCFMLQKSHYAQIAIY